MWWLIPLIMKMLSKKGGAAGTAASAMGATGIGSEGIPNDVNTSDITSKIAQNQLWGNIQTADPMGDQYSPFFGADQNTPMPNPDVGFNLPGQQTPFNQSDLLNELIKKYLSNRYGWR